MLNRRCACTKNYLYLFVYMVMSLAFLAGCGTYDNSNSGVVTENTIEQTALSQAAKAPDWETTSFKTVNNFNGVAMNVKGGTASSTSVTLAFENHSSSHCVYGTYFCLEKKINGIWYRIPVVIDGNYAFTDIAYNLASGGYGEQTVNWGWLYGNLDPGEYRIVKDISDFRGPGNFTTYYLAADFTI